MTSVIYRGDYQSAKNIDPECLNDKSHLCNGIDRKTLENIYHNLYRIQYGNNNNHKVKILVNTVVNSQIESNNSLNLEIYNKSTRKSAKLATDIIIYCTGLEYKIPEFMNPIKSMFEYNEYGIAFDDNQCAKLTEKVDNKIFLLNGPASGKQINNQHLALGAYYSAKVINTILGYNAY